MNEWMIYEVARDMEKTRVKGVGKCPTRPGW